VLGSFSANHSKFDYHNIPGIRDRKRHPRRDRFESVIVTTTGHPFGNEWVQKYVVQDDLITEMEKYNIVGPRAALQPSLHPDQAAGCS
jgi:hypothetical protein